jgi:hypothetical protein
MLTMFKFLAGWAGIAIRAATNVTWPKVHTKKLAFD